MRYFIEVAFLGTHFHGWQMQKNAASIQEELENALSTILERKVGIHGSSRTDTGVHARQQYAHFNLESPLEDIQNLIYRMNRFLHKDISVSSIAEVAEDAHARFDALGRKYIYRIIQKKNPFIKDIAALYTRAMDLDQMNKACKMLFDHTDFQCFSKVKTDVFTYNCVIKEAKWEKNEDVFEFHIQSDRFLRGMVRAIAGTLLDVGYHKTSLEDFEQIILSKDRRNAGMAVKAEGLTLEKVIYPEGYFKDEN